MHPVEKLLIAAGIGRSIYGGWRLHKIMPVVAAVAVLAVAATVMTAVLAMGGMYAVYLFVLGQGIEPAGALLVTMLVALFITLSLLAAIRYHIRKLKSQAQNPVQGMADAFLDGLLAE